MKLSHRTLLSSRSFHRIHLNRSNIVNSIRQYAVFPVNEVKHKYKAKLGEGSVIWAHDFPSDTPATNSLLTIPDEKNFIKFSGISPFKLLRAYVRNIIHYDLKIEDIERNQTELSFQELNEVFEECIIPMEYCLGVLRLMNSINPRRYADRFLFDSIKTYDRFLYRRFTSPVIYESMKKIDPKSLNEIEQKVLHQWLSYAKKLPVSLNPDKVEFLRGVDEEILFTCREFNQFAAHAEDIFQLTIDDVTLLKDFPDDLRTICDNVITLNPVVTATFLERCPDRKLRQQNWYSYNNRASLPVAPSKMNSSNIETLREERMSKAKVYGYENYVDFVLDGRLLSNLDEVKDYIDTIHDDVNKKFTEDVEDLKKFAIDNGLIDDGKLQLWDLSFVRYEMVKAKYPVGDLSLFFPFQKVFNGIASFVDGLFNIKFEEITDESIEKWNEDTKLYRVTENNNLLGHFYLDPYKKSFRSPKIDSSQCIELTCLSDIGTKPLCAIFSNINRLMFEGKDSYMTLSEVVSTFKSFGRMIQFMTCNQPHYDLSSFAHLDRSQIDWCSELFGIFILNDYDLMRSISEHSSNGEPVSRSLFDTIHQMTTEKLSINLNYEIFLGSLDLAFNSNSQYWRDILKEVWKVYMSPIEFNPDYHYPCGAYEMMTGKLTALFFTRELASVMASQTFSKLVKSEDVKAEAQRFREIVLANGVNYKIKDIFESYHGEKLNPKPFLVLNRIATN